MTGVVRGAKEKNSEFEIAVSSACQRKVSNWKKCRNEFDQDTRKTKI